MNRKTMKPFDLNRLTRYSLHDRSSKVDVDHFGKTVTKGMSVNGFIDALPDILAGKNLKELARAISTAREKDRPVHFSMGAHVLKVGLGPLLIDLLERKILTGLSVNGAVLVHDYEIAAAGKTSEDVDAQLGCGQFGMVEETCGDLARFISHGVKEGLGLAGSIGSGIFKGEFPYKDLSLLGAAWRLDVPMTAHPALGTDITHLWPGLDWAILGEGANRDFLTFISLVEQLAGSVYLNVGSAVVLPEVFLKAVTSVRNAGADHSGIVTANFDFIQHYRPTNNVVKRPTDKLGKGYAFTGHHEIMIPLLFAAVSEML